MIAADLLTDAAVRLCLIAAGVFFMTGLLTGVWKYHCIRHSPEAQAPVYVDIAHRASLLYSFASLLLAQFAALSAFSIWVNFWAAAAALSFFAAAIAGYIFHGLARDTDNQLRVPHRFGKATLPRALVTAFMLLLIVAEVGGSAVLFFGMLKRMNVF
ncbi:MAG TPA: hypothetical protein VN046_04525 [Stenotrophobium sp.]|nr:hypothetical protein [Stenotrophobium sp.]